MMSLLCCHSVSLTVHVDKLLAQIERETELTGKTLDYLLLHLKENKRERASAFDLLRSKFFAEFGSDHYRMQLLRVSADQASDLSTLKQENRELKARNELLEKDKLESMAKNDWLTKEVDELRVEKAEVELKFQAEVEKRESLEEVIKSARARGQLVAPTLDPVQPKNTVVDSKQQQAKKMLTPEQQQKGNTVQ